MILNPQEPPGPPPAHLISFLEIFEILETRTKENRFLNLNNLRQNSTSFWMLRATAHAKLLDAPCHCTRQTTGCSVPLHTPNYWMLRATSHAKLLDAPCHFTHQTSGCSVPLHTPN